MRNLFFILFLTILVQSGHSKPTNKLEDDFYVDLAAKTHNEEDNVTSEETRDLLQKYSKIVVVDRDLPKSSTNMSISITTTPKLGLSTNVTTEPKNVTDGGSDDKSRTVDVVKASSETETSLLKASNGKNGTISLNSTTNGTSSEACNGKMVAIAGTQVCIEASSPKPGTMPRTRRPGQG
jgi:hypothetical protein